MFLNRMLSQRLFSGAGNGDGAAMLAEFLSLLQHKGMRCPSPPPLPLLAHSTPRLGMHVRACHIMSRQVAEWNAAILHQMRSHCVAAAFHLAMGCDIVMW